MLFTPEWKTNYHLVILIQKKIKKNWSVIDPCSYFIAQFSGIFRIRASSISAHSWRLKDEFGFWIQKAVCNI